MPQRGVPTKGAKMLHIGSVPKRPEVVPEHIVPDRSVPVSDNHIPFNAQISRSVA